ncbi:MAG TPA: hypothetical protein VJ577_19030 [Burkholderiaceae bacterium]|nr:hypothetical protein [Burkholderiaceae bacterium]
MGVCNGQHFSWNNKTVRAELVAWRSPVLKVETINRQSTSVVGGGGSVSGGDGDIDPIKVTLRTIVRRQVWFKGPHSMEYRIEVADSFSVREGLEITILYMSLDGNVLHNTPLAYYCHQTGAQYVDNIHGDAVAMALDMPKELPPRDMLREKCRPFSLCVGIGSILPIFVDALRLPPLRNLVETLSVTGKTAMALGVGSLSYFTSLMIAGIFFRSEVAYKQRQYDAERTALAERYKDIRSWIKDGVYNKLKKLAATDAETFA